MERAMIFVDGNNFYHAAKNLLRQPPKLDMSKLVKVISQKDPNRFLLRTYYYTVDEPAQQGLVSYLRSQPRFIVNNNGYIKKKSIPGKIFDENDPSTYVKQEKGTDVNLATDLLIGAYMNSYDTAIILSADGDYIGPIKEIRKIGKIVELVVAKGQPISKKLSDVADSIIEIEKSDLTSCWNGTYNEATITT
ncbi:LabA-like NYN domain-containing protein [Shouchella clausii]|uniref:LabA-like NYN domain-containing protein n=1 Tax=Shouchella clausii TaxID=79880 RepID=UPI000BA70895|nr:NYN domain-containing protein [Shouchella clausii]PAD17395.1 hypothetical protein CHH74_01860 [Shouchella clausii]